MANKYCRFCGKELVNGVCDCQKFRESMRAESEQHVSFKDLVNEEKVAEAANQVKDAAGKAYDLGKNVAEKAYKAGKEASDSVKSYAQAEREKNQKKYENETYTYTNSSPKSNKEIWSWLKKSSKRKYFYTEEMDLTTEEEFAEEVQHKIWENNVPVKIQPQTIRWDQSQLKQDVFQIVPQTKFNNPFTCLLQFNHVGNFSFVEEKVFIAPPNLPPVPGEKVPANPFVARLISCMLIGGLLFFAGLGNVHSYFESEALLAILIGLILFIVGLYAAIETGHINEQHEKVRDQEAAWEKAWSDWHNNILSNAFQEDIDGELSRIFDATYECISQVCDEKFVDVLSEEAKEVTSLASFEEMIQRRKEEYR